MNSQQAAVLVGQFENVSVKDHFGGDGFSANKRMFMTIWHEKNQATVRLSPAMQLEFLSLDGEAFRAIDNSWGRQGWTHIHLEFVDRADFLKAAQAAFAYSAVKGPSNKKSSASGKAVKSQGTRGKAKRSVKKVSASLSRQAVATKKKARKNGSL